jgi:hypothetical protein
MFYGHAKQMNSSVLDASFCPNIDFDITKFSELDHFFLSVYPSTPSPSTSIFLVDLTSTTMLGGW